MKLPGTIFLTAALSLSVAALGQGRTLDHYVAVDTVETAFAPGDRITIEEVRGTSESVEAGNLYEVRGSYKLSSRASATLAIYTTTATDDPGHTDSMSLQKTTVDRGTGTFVLYVYLWQKGYPHISFYPAGSGGSFGGVYFGTGSTSPNGVDWIRKMSGRTDRVRR